MNKEIPWQSQGLMERHTLLLEQRVSVGTTSLQWSSDYCFPPFLSFSGRAFLWSCSSFVVVQLLSCVWLFVTLWTAACLAFIVLHHLPEFAHTHVHWVGDALQPSHPLSSPSPSTFNLSQHQGLSQWKFFASGGQSIGVSASASVLPMNIQHWFPLGWTG